MSTESYAEALLDRIRLTLIDCRVVSRDSGIVVAFSGGPDSVALLHALNSLKLQMGFWIVAAHLDHKLRADSNQDVEFVRQFAAKLGTKLILKEVDVRALAAEQSISIEEAGRRARYGYLEEVRQTTGAHTVATGHHLDDALETFFLRLFRGSSLQGLRGIDFVRGHIIRPLIGLRREEILRYLNEQDISYRIDHTNLVSDTDRNFIRNRLFPLIRERFPDFRKPLERTLELIDQENRLIDDLASQVSSEAIVVGEGMLTISGSVLQTVPAPVAGRAILAALYRLTGPHVRWGRVHVRSVMGILNSRNPSARTFLPGGIVVQRQYDKLIVAPHTERESEAPPQVIVTGAGHIEFLWADVTLEFRLITGRGDLPERLEGRRVAYFDADRISFPLLVRTFRPGDRFRPWGISGTRKLKKVFIDERVPRDLRRNWPLLVKDDEIIWIPGIRRGQAGPILPRSSRILEVRVIGGNEQSMQFVKS